MNDQIKYSDLSTYNQGKEFPSMGLANYEVYGPEGLCYQIHTKTASQAKKVVLLMENEGMTIQDATEQVTSVLSPLKIRHSWKWHGRGMKCTRCGSTKATGEIYYGDCRDTSNDK